jgi:hypothetical protein
VNRLKVFSADVGLDVVANVYQRVAEGLTRLDGVGREADRLRMAVDVDENPVQEVVHPHDHATPDEFQGTSTLSPSWSALLVTAPLYGLRKRSSASQPARRHGRAPNVWSATPVGLIPRHSEADPLCHDLTAVRLLTLRSRS